MILCPFLQSYNQYHYGSYLILNLLFFAFIYHKLM